MVCFTVLLVSCFTVAEAKWGKMKKADLIPLEKFDTPYLALPAIVGTILVAFASAYLVFGGAKLRAPPPPDAIGPTTPVARAAPTTKISRESRLRVLVLVVFLDLLAVSLVVPLLPAKFRSFGVSKRAYGLISSTCARVFLMLSSVFSRLHQCVNATSTSRVGGDKQQTFASARRYSLSQIVGGLTLGALSDRHLGRRGLLLLSFTGAAAACVRRTRVRRLRFHLPRESSSHRGAVPFVCPVKAATPPSLFRLSPSNEVAGRTGR